MHRWLKLTLGIALTIGPLIGGVRAEPPAEAECQLPERRTELPFERFLRAGRPDCIARWARPSDEPRDGGYYVGGGAAVRGEPSYVHEGTWGWDYTPWYSRVNLNWSHGRKYQGGSGQFQQNRLKFPLRSSLSR